MKLTQSFTAECCKFRGTFSNKHEAIAMLLNHIKSRHPDKYRRLAKKGRSEFGDGWNKAQPSFRRAWIETALKRQLGCY